MEISNKDFDVFVDYMNDWNEYISDYQKRLEDIPIKEIEKFLRKKNLENIEI